MAAERCKAWRKRNPDKVNALNRKSYATNKDKRRESRRAWRMANPDKVKNRKLRAAYGITLDQFRAMWKAQGSVCALCKVDDGRTPHVDHCHESGAVRGLLCSKCNGSLGWWEKVGRNIPAYLMRTPMFESLGRF